MGRYRIQVETDWVETGRIVWTWTRQAFVERLPVENEVTLRRALAAVVPVVVEVAAAVERAEVADSQLMMAVQLVAMTGLRLSTKPLPKKLQNSAVAWAAG